MNNPEAHESDEKRRDFPVEAAFLQDPVFRGFTCFGVTDEDGCLVHEFTPTRRELQVLARDYLEEDYRIEFELVVLGQSCSHGSRFQPFAWRRIETIGKMLGKESLEQVLAPVKEKWATLFADAAEFARHRDVEQAWHVGDEDPEFQRLLQKHGYVSIPAGELRPIDTLPPNDPPTQKPTP